MKSGDTAAVSRFLPTQAKLTMTSASNTQHASLESQYERHGACNMAAVKSPKSTVAGLRADRGRTIR